MPTMIKDEKTGKMVPKFSKDAVNAVIDDLKTSHDRLDTITTFTKDLATEALQHKLDPFANLKEIDSSYLEIELNIRRKDNEGFRMLKAMGKASAAQGLKSSLKEFIKTGGSCASWEKLVIFMTVFQDFLNDEKEKVEKTEREKAIEEALLKFK